MIARATRAFGFLTIELVGGELVAGEPVGGNSRHARNVRSLAHNVDSPPSTARTCPVM
jgi:hypothetical protein